MNATWLLLSPTTRRARVEALLVRSGLRLANIVSTPGEGLELLAHSLDGRACLRFLHAPRLDLWAVEIRGHDPDPLMAWVRGALSARDLGDVERAAKGDAAERAWAAAAFRLLGEADRSASLRAELDPLREQALEALDARVEEPSPPLPHRPRLSQTVLARLHLVEGKPKVILHDWRSARVLEIDPGSFHTLTLADGSRDLDAIALALAADGAYAGREDLEQLFRELDGAGVLQDGLSAPTPSAPVPPITPAPGERALEPLPDYALRCDGSGGCCRFYGSVSFSAEEARRAQVIAESMHLPLAVDDTFTPLHGAQLGDGSRAVAQVDGRCVFLEPDDGACGLHRRAGPEGKPLPCRVYPAMFMDDGVSVRVSLGPECACVFAGLPGHRLHPETEGAPTLEGFPLAPAGAERVEDLPEGITCMTLPEPVPVSAKRTAPRVALRLFSDSLVAELADTSVDVARLSWRLAAHVEREGLEPGVLEAALADESPIEGAAPWLAALEACARKAAETHESWRSATDLSRRTARWLADAIEAADAATLLELPAEVDVERFYLRALAHGHRLSTEGRSLAHGLRDRAIRLLAARAMAETRPDEPAMRYPIALLEASMRNLGLGGYADELPTPK